jgi:hypothetical protein
MSVFQGLSLGNIGHPPIAGLPAKAFDPGGLALPRVVTFTDRPLAQRLWRHGLTV